MKTKWIEETNKGPGPIEEIFMEIEMEIARIELENNPNYLCDLEI